MPTSVDGCPNDLGIDMEAHVTDLLTMAVDQDQDQWKQNVAGLLHDEFDFNSIKQCVKGDLT